MTWQAALELAMGLKPGIVLQEEGIWTCCAESKHSELYSKLLTQNFDDNCVCFGLIFSEPLYLISLQNKHPKT